MLRVLYNFTNAVDEAMTQSELAKTPEGNDFIKRWTWENSEPICPHHPQFKKSNSIEDYFYVRLIEEDHLVAIGGLRIHWDKDGKLMLDTTIQIVQAGTNYHWCENPNTHYDTRHIIKTKLYQYMNHKLIYGRFCDRFVDVDGCQPIPNECHSDHHHHHDCYPDHHHHDCYPDHHDCHPPHCHHHDDCEFPIHGAYGGDSGVVYDIVKKHHRDF